MSERLRFSLEIIAMLLLALVGMAWAFTKIAIAHHQISADPDWLVMFGAMALIGCGLIIWAGIRAIRDC